MSFNTSKGAPVATTSDTVLCRCQGRVAEAAIDGAGIDERVAVTDGLCRQGGAASLPPSVRQIGCTREAPLIEAAAPADRALRFFPAREYASGGAADAPRLAALIAMARLPEPPPVDAVSYASTGRLAIVGSGPLAMAWAQRLHGKADGQLQVTVFADDEHPLPAASPRKVPVHRARQVSVEGWLGAFHIGWTPGNAVDAAACTGCGACLTACSSDAIVRDGVAAYVDAARCNDKRRCIEVCNVGAIDFSFTPRTATFDLVLDLSDTPRLAMPHLPQGYFAPGGDALAQAEAALALTELVGEFDKPRFFDYDRAKCAHSRNRIDACSRCIDTCSTSAIRADGNGVYVEPHLCMGCGACASVCPSGAMRYNYPSVVDIGQQIRTALAAWVHAGGSAPTLLFHGREQASALKAWAETDALAAPVLPLAVHDAASVGPDLLLYALCAGAGRVVIWQGAEAPATYQASAGRAVRFADAVVAGLGLAAAGERFASVCTDADALMAHLGATAPALGAPARFHPQLDKRATLDLCFAHLATLAAPEALAEPLPVPAGSAYGTVAVAGDKCTLCLSCASACPAQALMDDTEAPRLRIREASCVQCGLCVATCPEDAITLVPRLNLSAAAKQPAVLHEDTPCTCLRCGKPFGSSATVRTLMERLLGNPHFAAPEQRRRLQMCGDCRVIDMMSPADGQRETTIQDLS